MLSWANRGLRSHLCLLSNRDYRHMLLYPVYLLKYGLQACVTMLRLFLVIKDVARDQKMCKIFPSQHILVCRTVRKAVPIDEDHSYTLKKDCSHHTHLVQGIHQNWGGFQTWAMAWGIQHLWACSEVGQVRSERVEQVVTPLCTAGAGPTFHSLVGNMQYREVKCLSGNELRNSTDQRLHGSGVTASSFWGILLFWPSLTNSSTSVCGTSIWRQRHWKHSLQLLLLSDYQNWPMGGAA
jgi:hypothetical protein